MGFVKLSFNVDATGCDDETVALMDKISRQVRDAFVMGLESTGVELRVQKTVTQHGYQEVVEEVVDTGATERERALTQEVATLRQLLMDADAVARRRGDGFGLCDAIRADGMPYPSWGCQQVMAHSTMAGIKPMLELKDLKDPES